MGNEIVEKLIAYSKIHLGLSDLDSIYVRNALLRKLNISAPYEGTVDVDSIKSLLVPDTLIAELKEYVLKHELVEESKIDLFTTEIMGDLTPLPSMVYDKFCNFQDSKHALDFLYDLQIKNNYIQKTAVDRNINWSVAFGNNNLELSINLSKPEKKNSDVAKLITAPVDKKYPQCFLCKENLGFAGNNAHPARENIRIIPINLDGSTWYIQYSPYVYYQQHCIVFDSIHQNMTMGVAKFRKLVDFVDQFPSFFIGSNAELPIVGGSILNHEHFQGGAHLMPLMFAQNRFEIVSPKYDKCKLSYVDFFNSTFKIETTNREQLVNLMNEIYQSWYSYDDMRAEILSHSGNVQHNTVTPIVRKVKDKYIAFIVLRNNRTSETYPDGIFHSHKEFHNIKSEGIGLIESSGLFILPARLKRQMEGIEKILTDENIDIDLFIKNNPDYELHRNFINELVQNNGRKNEVHVAHELVKNGIGIICGKILENSAVFKNTEAGRLQLEKFIKTLNI